MNFMKKFISLLTVFFIGSTFLFGQFEPQQAEPATVSDDELKLFAAAFIEVQEIDHQAQEEMMGAVEGSGLTVDRYNEIQQSQHMPDQDANATEEEMESYEKANENIGAIQASAQQEMIEKIEDEGLSINRYQEIMMAVQNDMQLQEKLQEYLQ